MANKLKQHFHPHRYKVLDKNGRSPAVGGSPGIKYTRGVWTKATKPVICKSGYHTASILSVLMYCTHEYNNIWEFEMRGRISLDCSCEQKKISNESIKKKRLVGTITPEKLFRMCLLLCNIHKPFSLGDYESSKEFIHQHTGRDGKIKIIPFSEFARSEEKYSIFRYKNKDAQKRRFAFYCSRVIELVRTKGNYCDAESIVYNVITGRRV